MKKKLLVTAGLCTIILFFSQFKNLPYHGSGSPLSSGAAPSGYAGNNGFTCGGCHGSFAPNSPGGSITTPGLPTTYAAGQAYDFSVVINHSAANRQRWGFILAARNAAGEPIGSFTIDPGTPNVGDVGIAEIGHAPAANTAGGTNSYTYAGLTWVAPVSPGPNDNSVTFYYVGNAADGLGTPTGDYIYTGTKGATVVPVTLSLFTAQANSNHTVTLNWQTQTESNSHYFAIERFDGNQFVEIGQTPAAGNASTAKNYTWTDKFITTFNKPVQYRLKQVDKDGRFTYSDNRSVTLQAKNLLLAKVVPNPVWQNKQAVLQLISSEATTAEITVVDASGKQAGVKRTAVVAGVNTIPLNFADVYSSGNYVLIIQTASQKQTVRFSIIQ